MENAASLCELAKADPVYCVAIAVTLIDKESEVGQALLLSSLESHLSGKNAQGSATVHDSIVGILHRLLEEKKVPSLVENKELHTKLLAKYPAKSALPADAEALMALDSGDVHQKAVVMESLGCECSYSSGLLGYLIEPGSADADVAEVLHMLLRTMASQAKQDGGSRAELLTAYVKALKEDKDAKDNKAVKELEADAVAKDAEGVVAESKGWCVDMICEALAAWADGGGDDEAEDVATGGSKASKKKKKKAAKAKAKDEEASEKEALERVDKLLNRRYEIKNEQAYGLYKAVVLRLKQKQMGGATQIDGREYLESGRELTLSLLKYLVNDKEGTVWNFPDDSKVVTFASSYAEDADAMRYTHLEVVDKILALSFRDDIEDFSRDFQWIEILLSEIILNEKYEEEKYVKFLRVLIKNFMHMEQHLNIEIDDATLYGELFARLREYATYEFSSKIFTALQPGTVKMMLGAEDCCSLFMVELAVHHFAVDTQKDELEGWLTKHIEADPKDMPVVLITYLKLQENNSSADKAAVAELFLSNLKKLGDAAVDSLVEEYEKSMKSANGGAVDDKKDGADADKKDGDANKDGDASGSNKDGTSSTAGAGAASSTSNANATGAVTNLMMTGGPDQALTVDMILSMKELGVEEPSMEFNEKCQEVFNQLVKENLGAQVTVMQEALKANAEGADERKKVLNYIAYHIVKTRAARDAQQQPVLIEFIEKLDSKLMDAVTTNTYESLRLLVSENCIDLAVKFTAHRTALKHLGLWLGSITIARNKTLKSKQLDLK